MASLADILAAAVHGNHPMGGHQIYQNDWPNAPRPMPAVPPAWLPPGLQMQPDAAPDGPVYGNPPDPAYKYVPRFHRLNPAPRDNWRDIAV